MDRTARLALDYLHNSRTAAPAKKKDPDDILKGLTPEEAEDKIVEVLQNALDAERKLAALQAELAPLFKMATTLGTSRRAQEMLKAAHGELIALRGIFVKIHGAEGHWKTGTQDQLIAAVLATNPELADLLEKAKAAAKNFNQGFSKLQVWDQKPADEREKAPYEVKLAATKLAELQKESGVWDTLKKVIPYWNRMSETAKDWGRSLFSAIYESFLAALVRSLSSMRQELEQAWQAGH